MSVNVEELVYLHDMQSYSLAIGQYGGSSALIRVLNPRVDSRIRSLARYPCLREAATSIKAFPSDACFV